jgi:hypothetical protein
MDSRVSSWSEGAGANHPGTAARVVANRSRHAGTHVDKPHRTTSGRRTTDEALDCTRLSDESVLESSGDGRHA